MDSPSQDVMQRALTDLQGFASHAAINKQKQRCADLKVEIDKKNQVVSGLHAQREDAIRAAELSKGNSALTFAFNHRAAILLEELERQKPHGLVKKWREECDLLSQLHLSAQILDNVKTMDFIDDEQ